MCWRALTSFLRGNNITRRRSDHRRQIGCLCDCVELLAFFPGRGERAYEISESNSVGVILMLSRDGICQSAISIVTAGRHWSAPRGQVPHQVVSLLKRWLIGTHQGGVSRAHLDYYLDEFTFRFNRRTSRYQEDSFTGVQQAVAVDPAPYSTLIKHVRPGRRTQRRWRHHNK